MMSFETYRDIAIKEIRDAIKNEKHGDKEKYIQLCIPYLEKEYNESKWEAEFFKWDEINTGGLGYGALMSYPGLEFLGGPSGDELAAQGLI